MKQVVLLFLLIAVLPLSKNERNTDFVPPVAFRFNATMGNPFLDAAKKTPVVDTNQLKQSGWYSAAMKSMAQSEYNIHTVENANTFSSPNRRNNLRFTYDENGFSVAPRTTKIPIGEPDVTKRPAAIKYKTIAGWKVSFNLDKKQIGDGHWQVNGNRAEYITDNITVQYINNEDGMRQNFIVQKPLSNDDHVQLRFNVQTKLAQRFSKDKLQFADKKSNVVLSYEQLKVWDANGKPLEATFEKSSHDYCIQVNTQQASYPITIDPLSTTAAVMLESNMAGAYFGYSVASAGDVNGDGFGDVIVGAPRYYGGQAYEGAAFIYHGSASGVSTTAAIMLECNQASAYMGASVASAGDVNGDGYSDVIVGAHQYDHGEFEEGGAFIYHGSASGISTTVAAMVTSNQLYGNMGLSIASAGDVNGDGYSDVIVGAYLYDNTQTDEGAAFIYHGSASGINTTAAAILVSGQAGANIGVSVAGAGDINGDGYSDVIVGAYLYDNTQTDEGAAFIYHGSASGINTTAAARVVSGQATAYFGISVASAGDMNGDGFSDIIVGAFLYDNGQTDEGAAFIYHGSASGINTTAAVRLESDQATASFGISVACAGDINGDGYSDVIVGAYLYDSGQNNEGAAFIYYGSAWGFNPTPVRVESNQASAYMGYSVASAGDVNGDGYSGVIVGAFEYDSGQNNEGTAFIYYGSASDIKTTAVVMLENDQASAFMGYSVANAGDINGDGYGDVIVGAPYFDNGQNDEGVAFICYGSDWGIPFTFAKVESNQAGANLGHSVAGAGDVNGDGYSDIIVGAPYYDNVHSDEGASFIYHGSASGINTTAAAFVASNQPGAYMGYSVAGAGDVNGDGFSDIIVGALFYDNGHTDEGAAFIYHGSASGISTTVAALVESNQAAALMGQSVASAGDVNGDGYSDVIAGASWYDNGETNEGVAFIYHGSASGINTTAAARVESNQPNARMGVSVAGAGDVNGDGYSDVIAGAHLYTNGQTEEGAAFIYHGSASGISTTAAASIESGYEYATMGFSVASAGDVNGDGYSDVIVGAMRYGITHYNEGAAFVYHGSASGTSITSAATVASGQIGALMGYSVAGAGDINGDGFSDIIVGAPYYSNGQVNEGAAFVYLGNSPGPVSKLNILTLYNSDLTTRINRSNFSAPNFGAGLFAKSFLGRNKGKLVWETKLNYNAFSGTPIANSAVYTSQQSGYTNLGLTGTVLKSLVNKRSPGRYTKIRARVKYDPVTALTGQVYGPWRYVPAQVAGLSLGALPVQLISFKAAWLQKGKTAQISFITDDESAICCYGIEKSTDGILFSQIGKVDALNTGTRHTYTFTDYAATGTKQYYRLKIMHTSGNIEYSNIQFLQSDVATEIVVFPNPATNLLQLRLNNGYEKMNVQIINGAGQVVKQFTNVTAANQLLQIPVSAMASGTYFLYLQSGSEKQVLQFVKE